MPDITLENIVREAQQPRVIHSFTKITGARIEMMAHKSVGDTNFNANWSFQYAEKDASENNKQFAVRAILELTKALVKMVDYAEDQDRYRTEVSAITPANQDVPEDIITGV